MGNLTSPACTGSLRTGSCIAETGFMICCMLSKRLLAVITMRAVSELFPFSNVRQRVASALPPWDWALVVAAGLHTVKDLYCNSCNALLGWRYCSAKEKAQRYKEGRL